VDLQKTQTEKVITLQADLTEDLEKLAARQRVSPDEIIATALRRYIRQLQEQKI
jgi:metal-responsive CopG/Arc/MetJ family transcriptional regulator